MSDFQEFAFSDKFRIFEEEKKKIEILRNCIFLKCLPLHTKILENFTCSKKCS